MDKINDKLPDSLTSGLKCQGSETRKSFGLRCQIRGYLYKSTVHRSSSSYFLCYQSEMHHLTWDIAPPFYTLLRIDQWITIPPNSEFILHKGKIVSFNPWRVTFLSLGSLDRAIIGSDKTCGTLFNIRQFSCASSFIKRMYPLAVISTFCQDGG